MNINVPDLPARGVARSLLTTRLGFRHKSEPVVKALDPKNRPIYWIGPAGAGQDAGPGTDFHAVAARLRVGVADQGGFDGAAALDTVRGWFESLPMTSSERTGIGMTSARTRDRLVERLRSDGVESAAVLERIRDVPRHLFVDEALASRAYEDTALPIGFGQTISQPYIVALMTEALDRGRRPARS